MAFEILPVGDGACSVVRCLWEDCEAVAVIDCGEWCAPGSRPAGVLVDHLSANLNFVSTLVVTHFDADHWKGLRDLAPIWAESQPAGFQPDVNVVYPGLPPDVARLPSGSLALISTAAGSSGLRAMDLLLAWESVTKVHKSPRVAGDLFRMGCDMWEVVWPPRILPSAISDAVEEGLDDLRDLANRMDSAGHPQLRRNLEEAYEGSFGFPGKTDRNPEDSVDGILDNQLHNFGIARDIDNEIDAAHDSRWLEREGDVLGEEDRAIPKAFAQETRALARRLGRMNNLLSLVFHNVTNRYQPKTLVLGDIEGAALQYLIYNRMLLEHYDLILAPHHGSHVVPAEFPSARVCVSQAGSRHQLKRANHVHSHLRSACLSTFSKSQSITVL